MSDWAKDKAYLFFDCETGKVLRSLTVEDVAEALREARAEGMREVAGKGCHGKDRVCCYDCWQLQEKMVTGEDVQPK